MPFPVEPNHKFASIALDGPSVDGALPDPYEIAPGVWAVRRAPVEIDDWWREGLGTWTLQSYKNCGLFLVAAARSARPGILDAENARLEKRLYGLHYALLLREAGHFNEGHLMTGAREGDAVPHVRQHSRVPECPPHPRASLPRVDAALLTSANAISVDLLRLFGQEEQVLPPVLPANQPAVPRVQAHGRVRRGFNALLAGFRGGYTNLRLHHFVRALEAVTHPPIGGTRKTWVTRCSVLAGGPPQTRVILEAIFDLRSAEEHLNEWQHVLGTGAGAEEAAVLHSYQAEVLACFVYRRLLEVPTLLPEFETDATTDAFWRRTNPTPGAAWGQTIDITEAGLRASGRLAN
jgi:hypothetical protein